MVFRKSNDDFPVDDRKWSDDQGYLDTLASLINKSHEASMDEDQDVYDWFFVLEQLQLEIVGQLIIRNLVEDKAKLDALRKKTKESLVRAYKLVGHKVGNLSPKDASVLRDIVYPYHESLAILIHKMDLRLHDVKANDDGVVPTWSRT